MLWSDELEHAAAGWLPVVMQMAAVSQLAFPMTARVTGLLGLVRSAEICCHVSGVPSDASRVAGENWTW
jgi:hypothetical protein